MKIILLGYMASGKSTVGKCLAKARQIPFVDLDKFIEQQEKKTIPNIFKENGEVYFRLKEHEYLIELLSKKEDFVLSLGGGTPCYAGNMNAIITAKNTISIYLKGSLKTISERLQYGKENRPLVAHLSDSELTEFVAKHLFERSFFYEKADMKVKTDGKSLKEVVQEIELLLS